MTDRQILEAILTEVKGLGTRMDGFESRMDGFESRMDGFENRMDRFENCMDRIENRMDRMEKRQERFEEETRNNFADIRLHLENITDRNISILAENHQNLIDKMNVPIAWMNRVMMNEVKINSLTDRVTKLEQKCS